MPICALILYGSKLLITTNGHNVYTFVPSKTSQQPYQISFTIPKKYIKDGKLQLQFRNTAGVVTAAQMGIALFNITLSESK